MCDMCVCVIHVHIIIEYSGDMMGSSSMKFLLVANFCTIPSESEHRKPQKTHQ